MTYNDYYEYEQESKKYYREQNSIRELENKGYKRNQFGEWKNPNNPLGFAAHIDQNGEIEYDIY